MQKWISGDAIALLQISRNNQDRIGVGFSSSGGLMMANGVIRYQQNC
ncbi:hypothetical protein [Nostoc sp. DSM 114167]